MLFFRRHLQIASTVRAKRAGRCVAECARTIRRRRLETAPVAKLGLEADSTMQYRLSTLFLIFFFVAASLATFDIAGIWIAFVFLLTALALHRNKTLSSGIGAVFVAGFFSVPGFLWPTVRNAREAAEESCSSCPVKGIGLGLLNYHEKHAHFPPLAITGGSGQPLRSWRVEVLPFLEYDALYGQIDKDQAWDSQRNRTVFEQSPNDTPFTAFGHSHRPGDSSTHYMAVVGPGTAWRSDRPVQLSELPDGGSHTVVLVEVADSGVHWAAPRDLTVDEALDGLKTGKGLRISSTLRNRTNVMMADSSIAYLPAKMPLSLWKRLLAGELSRQEIDTITSLIDPDAPDMVDVSIAPKGFEPGTWGLVFALLVWLIALVLLFRRAVRSREPSSTSAAA